MTPLDLEVKMEKNIKTNGNKFPDLSRTRARNSHSLDVDVKKPTGEMADLGLESISRTADAQANALDNLTSEVSKVEGDGRNQGRRDISLDVVSLELGYAHFIAPV